MARARVKVEGFADLNQAFAELSKSAGNAVLRRVGSAAMEPMRAAAESLAPDDMKTPDPDLQSSIVLQSGTGTRAMNIGRQKVSDIEAGNRVNIAMGPDAKLPRSPRQSEKSSGYTRALVMEFGSYKDKAQPYMRPAFDREAMPTITRLRDSLGAEIARAAERARRRAARRAAKGG